MSCKKAAKESVACMETCLQHHTDRLCTYQQVCDVSQTFLKLHLNGGMKTKNKEKRSMLLGYCLVY